MSDIKPSVIIKIDIDYYKKIQYIAGMLGLTPSQWVSQVFYESTFKQQVDATYSVFLRNQELLQKAKMTQSEQDKFVKDYLDTMSRYHDPSKR